MNGQYGVAMFASCFSADTDAITTSPDAVSITFPVRVCGNFTFPSVVKTPEVSASEMGRRIEPGTKPVVGNLFTTCKVPEMPSIAPELDDEPPQAATKAPRPREAESARNRRRL